MVLRNAGTAALLVCLASFSASAATAPDTPAGRLMSGLIASINSRSEQKIETFVRQSFAGSSRVADAWPTPCCNSDDITKTLWNVSRRSGGVMIDDVQANGDDVVAFVTTKIGGVKIYLNIHATGARIKNYQLVPMLHPISEVLPPVADNASPEQRVAAARQALAISGAKGLYSGTVVIAAQGKVLVQGAFGEADRAAHKKITLDTRFGIASVGKLFTGVAVAQLVAAGKLDYDTPIIRYLPDYPNKAVAGKITLRQLLTHRSGLADIYSEAKPDRPLRKLADYYPLFASKPLLFEPGKGQSYSNTGFLVASMVVERVSGEDFRAYLRRHIFQPAGMTHTGWDHTAGDALPYMLADADDPLRPDRPWVSAESFYANLLGGPAAGAGGEYSTAGDLLAFATALRDGRLLGHQALLKLAGSGLGCVCYVAGGHHIYSHTGGGPGVDTGVQLDVESGFVSVFLSNFSPPFPQQLAEELERLLRR